MERIAFLMIITLLGMDCFAQIPEAEDWNLVEEYPGMKVYTRMPEESKFKEVKMDFEVNASVGKIIEYISVASRFPKWVYSCKKAYSLEIEGEDIYYILFDMPWPIEDRDIVQKSLTQIDSLSGIAQIYTRALESDLPKKKNVVRVVENNIYWRLYPLGENKTRILYYAIGNPGGRVPAWLVNMIVTVGPKNTIKQLIEQVEKD